MNTSDQEKVKVVLIGDSRLCGFSDRLTCPDDLEINFVIRRGARVNDLIDPTLELISSVNKNIADILIVKIACGINNFTSFVHHEGGTELRYSGVCGKDVFDDLRSFKLKIKAKKPDALVGFITVPTLSFKKNIEFRLKNGKLRNSKFNECELSEFQSKLDYEISSLNSYIKLENSSKQEGHNRGCRTISWHRSITKESKRRRNKNAVSRTVTRNNFNPFYDGLHPTIDLKQKWFMDVCECARREHQYTLNEKAHLVKIVVSEQHSDLESAEVASSPESDSEHWDFKRRKTKN